MKGSLIEFSLGNLSGISIFQVWRIRNNANILSKLQAVYLFNDLDNLEKLIKGHYNANNVTLSSDFDLKNSIIYLMIRYLYQDKGDKFCNFIFKTLADNHLFFDFYTKVAYSTIEDMENNLSFELMYDIVDKESSDYNALDECIRFMQRVHYKIIASVELTIRPNLYKRINKVYKRSYSTGDIIPYDTPITFLEYISKLVVGNNVFIEEKLPKHLRDQLMAYQSIYNQYLSIKMKYVKI